MIIHTHTHTGLLNRSYVCGVCMHMICVYVKYLHSKRLESAKPKLPCRQRNSLIIICFQRGRRSRAVCAVLVTGHSILLMVIVVDVPVDLVAKATEGL